MLRCAACISSGSASAIAFSAAARSPFLIASSTVRTAPRIWVRRDLLTMVRRAILRVAFLAEVVLAMFSNFLRQRWCRGWPADDAGRQDWSVQTYTLRHNDGEPALPIRRLQAFKPGEGMGGAANHWNGQTWRWSESDPVLRTHHENRYGRKAIPAEMAIQDWGVTYA